MKGWILLTISDGRTVHIRSQNITGVYPRHASQRYNVADSTFSSKPTPGSEIAFGANELWTVAESVDEVLKKIEAAEADETIF